MNNFSKNRRFEGLSIEQKRRFEWINANCARLLNLSPDELKIKNNGGLFPFGKGIVYLISEEFDSLSDYKKQEFYGHQRSSIIASKKTAKNDIEIYANKKAIYDRLLKLYEGFINGNESIIVHEVFSYFKEKYSLILKDDEIDKIINLIRA